MAIKDKNLKGRIDSVASMAGTPAEKETKRDEIRAFRAQQHDIDPTKLTLEERVRRIENILAGKNLWP